MNTVKTKPVYFQALKDITVSNLPNGEKMFIKKHTYHVGTATEKGIKLNCLSGCDKTFSENELKQSLPTFTVETYLFKEKQEGLIKAVRNYGSWVIGFYSIQGQQITPSRILRRELVKDLFEYVKEQNPELENSLEVFIFDSGLMK